MKIHLYCFFVAAFFCADQGSASASDWRTIPGSDSLFDASRVIRISPGIIRVWKKYVLNEGDMATIQKEGVSDQYLDYSYSVSQMQINCNKQSNGFVSIINYNSKGYLTCPAIHKKDSTIEMESVIPDTEGEAVLKAVCDYVNKETKSKKRR